MYYLIVQLFKTEYKDDLLLALTSLGIQKGSLFEGKNLDKVLQNEVPFISGLFKSQDDRERYAALFMGIVENRNQVDELVDLLKEAEIDIQNEEIMRIILLPAEVIIDNQINWNRKDA